MHEEIQIAPSILSADFAQLAEAIASAEAGGADFIHVDVMDGHFVPNLTIGPPVVAAVKRHAAKPVDVHLMIDNVDDTVGWYLDAGADVISVHAEGTNHLHRVVQRIRSAGAAPAVALNPATPVSVLTDIIGYLDMVLVMSVNPGFGGQAFIPHTAAKIRELVSLCEREGVSPLIQVDGGISPETAPAVAEAGARCLVAGNAVFGQSDPAGAIGKIRRAAQAALG